MRRCLVAASFLVLALMLVPNEAPGDGKKGDKPKANDGVITDWGKPKDFEVGKVNAYWIWYDEGVWYFRTTGGGKGAHSFQGTIEVVGGQLIDLKGKKGEFKGKKADRFAFGPKGIVFDFKTDEGVEGLNFAVDRGATALKFTLALDGDAAPRHIRIGKQGDHPKEAVFTVPAHPPDPPKGK